MWKYLGQIGDDLLGRIFSQLHQEFRVVVPMPSNDKVVTSDCFHHYIQVSGSDANLCVDDDVPIWCSWQCCHQCQICIFTHFQFSSTDASKFENSNQEVYEDYVVMLHILLDVLIFFGTSKTKLVMLAFLYCREFVKKTLIAVVVVGKPRLDTNPWRYVTTFLVPR